MRQIELSSYICPRCLSNLHCRAVDFTHKKDGGGETKSTFVCAGCREQFYSIEEAVELKTETKFNCPYCAQQATNMSLKDDWTDYWKCIPCKSSFEVTYSPYFEGLQTVNMYATIRGSLYVLRQFMDKGKSRIELLPDDPEDTVAIAQEFEFLFPNVTPTNVHDKIITYILFS